MESVRLTDALPARASLRGIFELSGKRSLLEKPKVVPNPELAFTNRLARNEEVPLTGRLGRIGTVSWTELLTGTWALPVNFGVGANL
jgi:hypothetical protein